MKKLLILSLVCTCSWLSHAQLRTKIDSLTQVLASNINKDTTRVKVLLELANTYRGVNLDTSYSYSRRAYVLSSESNYEFGMASADKISGTYFLYSGVKDSTIFYYQRSQKLFRSLENWDGVHDINYNLGLMHASISEYDQAIAYYKEDFNYRNEIKDTLGIADGYLNMGAVYLYQGDNQKAYKNFTASIPYFEQAGDFLSVAKVNFNLGTIQWNYSNYDLALNDFFSSLEVFEKEGDHYLLASCLENIAGVYENMDNYENALKYYRASLRHSEEVGDQRLTASNYHSLGTAMDKSLQRDSALYYFDKSVELSQKSDFKDLLSLNYHSLGVLHARENVGRGISFLEQSIGLKKDLEVDDFNIATSLHELGKIYLGEKQYSKAQQVLDEGWNLSRKTDSKEIKSQLSFALYELHKARGNDTKAITFLEQYQQFKDSIFDEETAKNVVAREIQYETAKKDQQIQLLVKEKELQEAELSTKEAKAKQNATQRNLLLAGIASLAAIAFLLFRNYNTKLKSRELINRKQQEFVNLRSRFFTNISHEFRTPLTLILGPLRDLLASRPNDSESRESYELMQRNGEKLLDLVNQLMDLSKLEAGTLPLRVSKSDLKKFLSIRTSSFSSLANYQDIAFDIELGPEISSAWFDSDALEKIINNLLSNAFKFTPKGGQIQFSAILSEEVSEEHHTNAGDFLAISVMDSGPGIAAEELPKVFDRFYQVDTSTSQKSGTGVGLALTKELVELHHGMISVESTVGKGSTFSVRLPVAQSYFTKAELVSDASQKMEDKKPLSTVITNKEEPKAKISNDQTQPLLLVVEDNADVRTYIKNNLSHTYNVIEAMDGAEGLSKAQEIVPDLVISDVMMPKMSGMSLCEKLKSDEKTSHIPVILLTALASQASKVEGIETGADDYIVKPFDKEELLARAKNLIQQRQLLREKYSRRLTLEPKELSVTSADERFLNKVIKVLEAQLDNSSFKVEHFSAELGMSRTQLFRKMRALTNQAPQDFIRDFRLKRAAQLLSQKTGTVSEIAYQVGFNNLSYFTKRFKELFGQTPSEYYAAHS